jgi:hypothetical protein
MSLNYWGEEDYWFEGLVSATVKNMLSNLVIKNIWSCVCGELKSGYQTTIFFHAVSYYKVNLVVYFGGYE